MKIICICRANIGRSQVLAGLLEKMFPQHTILSAGTKVVSRATGESKHNTRLEEAKGSEKVIEVLKEEEIDWAGKTITQLSPEMLKNVDRVIVMSEPEHTPEYLKNHSKMIHWEIADLKETPIEFHRKIRDELKKLIDDNKELFT